MLDFIRRKHPSSKFVQRPKHGKWINFPCRQQLHTAYDGYATTYAGLANDDDAGKRPALGCISTACLRSAYDDASERSADDGYAACLRSAYDDAATARWLEPRLRASISSMSDISSSKLHSINPLYNNFSFKP